MYCRRVSVDFTHKTYDFVLIGTTETVSELLESHAWVSQGTNGEVIRNVVTNR